MKISRKECRKCKDGKNNGWMYYENVASGELCYKYISLSQALNWHEAKTYCEERETHLLTLETTIKFKEFQEKFVVERKRHHTRGDHVKAWVH